MAEIMTPRWVMGLMLREIDDRARGFERAVFGRELTAAERRSMASMFDYDDDDEAGEDESDE